MRWERELCSRCVASWTPSRWNPRLAPDSHASTQARTPEGLKAGQAGRRQCEFGVGGHRCFKSLFGVYLCIILHVVALSITGPRAARSRGDHVAAAATHAGAGAAPGVGPQIRTPSARAGKIHYTDAAGRRNAYMYSAAPMQRINQLARHIAGPHRLRTTVEQGSLAVEVAAALQHRGLARSLVST